MNRSCALLVLALVLAAAVVGQLSGADSAYATSPTVTFTELIGASLTGVSFSSDAWGDYDSDGDLDILLTGYTTSGPISEIYKNNGNGTFSRDNVADGGLAGVDYGSVAWGDYNSDGKPDILLTGLDGSLIISKIYKNNGNGTFSETPFTVGGGLTGVYRSSVAWGDYNSDGKPDILLTGMSDSSPVSSVYFRDDTATADIAPSAPANLTAVPDSGSEVTLSWDAASDAEQSNGAGLTYNLRVGTTSGTSSVVSPMALASGTRLVPQYGNVGERTSYALTGLTPGATYYWSVQAIDSSFVGSGFATEGSFTMAPVFAFSAASYSVDEADGTVTVTVKRTGLTTGTDTVHFATANGTATAGSDYTDETQTLTFDPGVPSRTIDIPITNDNSVEPSETVQLTLADASSPGTVASPSTATLTIADNDRSFAFSSATYSVGEAGGSATVTINRTGLTTGSDWVHLASSNGSATAGSDYTSISQDVFFSAGQSERTVSIPITDDAVHEGNETVSLTLTGPSDGATLGGQDTATLTIVDNDVATLAFSAASYSIGEAGPAASITINRTGATGSAFTVNFTSANGTATAGSDYAAVNQTVTFPAGQTSKTVSIPITDDSTVESSETVLLSLSNPSTGASLGSPRTATLTITDNDVAPPPPTTHPATTTPKGKLSSVKLSKKSFTSAQAGKVKLSCKFSPKSKVFKYVLSLKKGKKWAVVKSAKKIGSFKTYTLTVKKLFAGKAIKSGSYKLKLSADTNSKTLSFRVK
jgi:hypothetical protein